MLATARRAREAAAALRLLTRHEKDTSLLAMADALNAGAPEIVAANELDVARAREAGTAAALIDRLTLTGARIADIAQALGNASLLRGSSSAASSNEALTRIMRESLSESGLPADSVQMVPGDSHESVKYLMTARGLVDVLIPRGGESLIRSVVDNSTVPVIETGVGNCHVYVDKDADIDKAIAIVLNSKAQRVSVCNAAETLLVHREIASAFLPRALVALREANVTIHGDAAFEGYALDAGIEFLSVTDEDWAAEYYSLDLAAGVVDSIDDAIAHIRTWSSGHTEAIVTDSQSAAQRFVAGVDSAAVMVNASTRFTDGGEFGFGAEIGISTQKLHARGPMGLTELTTTTYVVTGDGHIRQ